MQESNFSWRGVPLTEIYGSQTAWGAPEFPLITPAFNHTVLYHISQTNDNTGSNPPKAQHGNDKWHHEYVRMPCSNQSLYPVDENGTTSLKKRWLLIEEALKKPIANSEELATAILSYNTKFRTVWRFRALHKLFNEYLEEEESQYFFAVTLPEIAKLALDLPKLIQVPIPLLKQHKNKALSMSQQQVASLLANAFFCTFPRRNTAKRTSEYASYPYINFNSLYECSGSESVLEKLKCLCHYFRRVCTKVPNGVLTFIRRSVPPQKCPKWAESERLLASTPLHVNSEGTIEDDGLGLIQVDFANKFLGGGVLRYGCVQEEIRFVICPELLISMLFTEVLRPNEALLMIGCEQFSKYTGYGSSFQWAGDFQDKTPLDSSGRRRCAVLAIDALPFDNKTHQYRKELIVREINKAWVGMSCCTSDEDVALCYPGVATGNWGCGAFGGSADLKSLLQLMAATEARRPMAYYTFGDVELRNNIINIYNLLSTHNVTVGQLFKILSNFSDVRKSQLYPYIHQSLVDLKKCVTVPSSSAPSPMDTSHSPVKSLNEAKQSPDIFSSQDIGSVEGVPAKIPKKEDMDDADSNWRTEIISIKDLKNRDVENGLGEDFNKRMITTNVSEVNEIKPRIQTTRLFEAMEKLDKVNGALNLNNSKIQDNELKLSDVESSAPADSGKGDVEIDVQKMMTDDDDDSLSLNMSADAKKKISKKITDYFSRKT